jgi:hypothetical protein
MDEKHGCLDLGLNLAIGFSGIDNFFLFLYIHFHYQMQFIGGWFCKKWMKNMDVRFRVEFSNWVQ